MNTLRAAILVLVALAAGASTCQKPAPPTNPVVAGVVNCAEQAVHDVSIKIIDDVGTAVATGDYVAALTKLVEQFGEAAVDCAVHEVLGTTTAHAQANELEAQKAERARAWLAGRPVQVQ
jgi:hypothetical protein